MTVHGLHSEELSRESDTKPAPMLQVRVKGDFQFILGRWLGNTLMLAVLGVLIRVCLNF